LVERRSSEEGIPYMTVVVIKRSWFGTVRMEKNGIWNSEDPLAWMSRENGRILWGWRSGEMEIGEIRSLHDKIYVEGL
jgi:hypothetical protein